MQIDLFSFFVILLLSFKDNESRVKTEKKAYEANPDYYSKGPFTTPLVVTFLVPSAFLIFILPLYIAQLHYQ